MFTRFLIISFFLIGLSSCSKEQQIVYEPAKKSDPYVLYKEGLEAFKRFDYFFANKKFSEAELNFEQVEYAAKSAIMSCYSLYGINFYDEAIETIKRYLKTYPSDKNIIYAHYLLAIIYFEQIGDEKKDIQPLINAEKQIDFFLKKYPDTDYALDLKFKKDLIRNQLAAKELYVAKYYITTQKWIPAINRLKNIINNFDKTIFVEEALFRLVEIHHHIGLESEAEKYASILGYNYNSSEWFAQSYKIFNKVYDFEKTVIAKNNGNRKKQTEKSFLSKIMEMIN